MCAEYNVPLAGIVPDDVDVAEADRAGNVLTPGRGRPRAARPSSEIIDFVDDALVGPSGAEPTRGRPSAATGDHSRVARQGLSLYRFATYNGREPALPATELEGGSS